MSKKKSDRLTQVTEFAQEMMNYHSDESIHHCKRVKQYSVMMCYAYNQLYPQKAIPEEDIAYIGVGAQLHDIGKIGIPDAVLHKPGKLTAEEYTMVQEHCTTGAGLIDHISEICSLGDKSRLLHNIVLYHHERWDGGGYPEHLKGNEIPIEAQLVSIAEVYEGMVGKSYAKPKNHEEAVALIDEGACGVFGPEALESFHIIADNVKTIAEVGIEERWDLLSGVFTRNRGSYWRVKRVFDFILSTCAAIVLSPLMLLLALIIFIDDPKGSPFFCQERLGRHKRPFTMYKFRTMVVNADQLIEQLQARNEKDGPAFKMKDDPRITRVGKFLRKTSLDELPQLFNIIKGDMAIVGPRPPLPREVAQYNRYYEMRLSVTPGLTCIWQAAPHRDNISFDKWMDMDVAYIAMRSLKLDVRIILGTVKAVFCHYGS